MNQETKFYASEAERHLFTETDAYWAAWNTRWHVYLHQPGPLVLPRPITPIIPIRENDLISWHGYTIRVIDTPGATDGAVSYVIVSDDQPFCFCGDIIYAGGKCWDLYSFQKGDGTILDYHSLLGNREKLNQSLDKVKHFSTLIPSHGPFIDLPEQAVNKLRAKMSSFWKNYISISSLNHYFPGFITDPADASSRMKPSPTRKPPSCVKRVGYTSFMLISEDKAGFLIDCGHDIVIDRIHQWISKGVIKSLEGCWVTHYHDDHTDSLGKVIQSFKCPIYTEQHMVDVLENPSRYFLPCQTPNPIHVTKAFADGESWKWHEFNMTAYHFPGQTYYHSGLLVENTKVPGKKHPQRIFFAGDSGSPTGIDDHCPPNRNFLGRSRGFRRCMEIWSATTPDAIFNQHQEKSFAFTIKKLEEMDQILDSREAILKDLLPWENPNFGLDELWMRTYPYQQDAKKGSTIAVDIQITNHHDQPASASLEPCIPDGWIWMNQVPDSVFTVPALTAGCAETFESRPDFSQRFWIQIPKNAETGRYILPFRFTWNGLYLGQFRHAMIDVW